MQASTLESALRKARAQVFSDCERERSRAERIILKCKARLEEHWYSASRQANRNRQDILLFRTL